MTVSMEDVRAALDPDEPDYSAVSSWGPEALPHLQELATQADPMLASKAVYAASLLEGDAGAGVVMAGARSSDDVVQVAAAAAAKNLPPGAAAGVLGALRTGDAGIAKVALASAPEGADPDVVARLKGAGGGADVAPPEIASGMLGGLMPGEQAGRSPMPSENLGLMPGESPGRRTSGSGDMPH